MTGALLIIKPGGLRELHWHRTPLNGNPIKSTGPHDRFGGHGRARTDEFSAGDVGYVPQGYGLYRDSDELQVIAVFNNATYEAIDLTA